MRNVDDRNRKVITSGPVTIEDGFHYIVDSVSLIQLVLPVLAPVGFWFKVTGKGTGGWQVTQNSGQQITYYDPYGIAFQTVLGVTGVLNGFLGKCTSEIECVTSSNEWRIINKTGLVTFSLNWFGTGSDGSLHVTVGMSPYVISSVTDGDIIVKNYVNLTIDTGAVVTVLNRCKGLVIYCQGYLINNGTISMAGKGSGDESSVHAGGLVFARFKTGQTDTGLSDLTGAGAAVIASEANQVNISGSGKNYVIPKSGACGAGGSGGAKSGGAGTGSLGTCFRGGSGGGGASSGSGTTSAVAGTGGNGGNASVGSFWGGGGGGGGVFPGTGGSGDSGGASGFGGINGCGGLLVIIVQGTIDNTGGVFTASAIGTGGHGGNAAGGGWGGGGGGGCGGGYILALAAGNAPGVWSGSLTVNGAAGGAQGTGSGGPNADGFAGNAGMIVTDQISI